MKQIVMKKTRAEILKNKYVTLFNLFGKKIFESVVDLLSLKSLSEMDLEETDGKASAHQKLEEAAQLQMAAQSQRLDELIRQKQERADFLMGIKREKENKKVDNHEGPPIVKKPAFMRRVITSMKPQKQDIFPVTSDDSYHATPVDGATSVRPKTRLSLAQVQAMLIDQAKDARETIAINANEMNASTLGENDIVGVAALVRQTGKIAGPTPPQQPSQLMQAIGSVRSRLRAGAGSNAPAEVTASEQE
jgi:hypothetical protein